MPDEKLEKMKASGWKPVRDQEAFPEHIREWAFQLWAYRCARDSRRVVAYMRVGEDDGTDPDYPPTQISDRTIRAWADRYQWSERQQRETKARHADQFMSVHVQNINNSVDAVRVQSEVLQMVKEDIEAKRQFIPEYDEKGKLVRPEPQLRLDARELKAVADFTNGILDRSGHLPYTRKENDRPTAPTANDPEAIGTKSYAELIELSSLRLFELAAKAQAQEPEDVIEVEVKTQNG